MFRLLIVRRHERARSLQETQAVIHVAFYPHNAGVPVDQVDRGQEALPLQPVLVQIFGP